MDVGAHGTTVACAAEALQLRPTTASRVESPSVWHRFRDDVDDAVHRVGAPQRGPGSADDFNPVDVPEGHILHVPEDAGVERRVHGAAIDEHQHLIGSRAVEPPGTDRPLTRVHLRHF